MATATAISQKPETPLVSKTPINPWIVALTVTLATFMELLDTSIANVALPHIAGGLGRSFDEVTWILTTYLVANAVVLPMSAWLSRALGRKNYYMASVLLFTISSFFCGIAPSLAFILISRVLQGVGGGGLAPVEQAILVDTFPPAKRASAFALYTVAIVTAPAIGPVLGGYITDHFSWRWVFLVNIPIGALSLFLTRRFVHDPPEFTVDKANIRQTGKLQIDGLGIALIGLGSAALEILLDRGQIEDWFGSRFIIGCFIVAFVCMGAAIFWELHTSNPIIELRLLKIRNFAFANVFYFLFGVSLFSSTTVIPQMLQSLFGYTATDAGLVLGPGAFAITLLAPVGAQLVQRRIVHPRILLFGALTVVGISFFYVSHMTLDTDYGHWMFSRVLTGFGYAFFFVPLSVVAYSQLTPGQNNKASSITNFFRNWGGSCGIALVTSMSERRADFHQSVIGSNQTASSPVVQNTIQQTAVYLQTHGLSRADAILAANYRVYQQLDSQSRFYGFMDCLHLLGLIVIVVAPLALLTKNFKVGGKAPAGH